MNKPKTVLRGNSPSATCDPSFVHLMTFPIDLATAQKGVNYIVSCVVVPSEYPQWRAQLEDIGFLPGERVAVMARGLPGGDPLVVRVGLSTFALRTIEAACVRIIPSSAAYQ